MITEHIIMDPQPTTFNNYGTPDLIEEYEQYSQVTKFLMDYLAFTGPMTIHKISMEQIDDMWTWVIKYE